MTITTLPEHLKPMVEKAQEAAWLAASELEPAISPCEAAILAFLNACLDGGVAKKAAAFEYGSVWTADTARPLRPLPMDFPALIAAGWRYVPPDSVVVPREPTEAMLDAASPPPNDWSKTEASRRVRETAKKIRADDYRAMIQAGEKD